MQAETAEVVGIILDLLKAQQNGVDTGSDQEDKQTANKIRSVTNVARSVAFYQRSTGIPVPSRNLGSNNV